MPCSDRQKRVVLMLVLGRARPLRDLPGQPREPGRAAARHVGREAARAALGLGRPARRHRAARHPQLPAAGADAHGLHLTGACPPCHAALEEKCSLPSVQRPGQHWQPAARHVLTGAPRVWGADPGQQRVLRALHQQHLCAPGALGRVHGREPAPAVGPHSHRPLGRRHQERAGGSQWERAGAMLAVGGRAAAALLA